MLLVHVQIKCKTALSGSVRQSAINTALERTVMHIGTTSLVAQISTGFELSANLDIDAIQKGNFFRQLIIRQGLRTM